MAIKTDPTADFELHMLQITRPSCPSFCRRCISSYFTLRNIEKMGEVAGQGETSGDGLWNRSEV
jgi:hypothetical protein